MASQVHTTQPYSYLVSWLCNRKARCKSIAKPASHITSQLYRQPSRNYHKATQPPNHNTIKYNHPATQLVSCKPNYFHCQPALKPASQPIIYSQPAIELGNHISNYIGILSNPTPRPTTQSDIAGSQPPNHIDYTALWLPSHTACQLQNRIASQPSNSQPHQTPRQPSAGRIQ